jgi:hypothetical protein
VREYVPHSGKEYDHVVALQTYVLHIDVRMVLRSLVVALIHESEWKANGCFGITIGYSKRVS